MSYLDIEVKFFGIYNYDACEEYENKLIECSKKERELVALRKAPREQYGIYGAGPESW